MFGFLVGAASAVAAKLAVEKYGRECVCVVYCNLLKDEHEDNARFLQDVEKWVGLPITVINSIKYESVDDVFEDTRYMSGVKGARCTQEMKRIPRLKFQREGDTHIFGFHAEEEKRMREFDLNNLGLRTDWILRERRISKQDCYRILQEAGIPAMYSLGYKNNNCIGCVKATSPGYWNKIRNDFPEIFQRRAERSRELGVRLVRVKGKRLFLDELPEGEVGRFVKENISCGPQCGL